MSQSFEQLWYTASAVGLNGTPGWQVRAASAGLRSSQGDRLQHLGNYVRYQLPQGVRPQAIRPEDAPVCLAWLDTGTERVVVHKAFIGLTWDRRPGNYFTHLVAGLPATFMARHAINLWESSFWQIADTLAPQQLALPSIHATELVAGPLGRMSLRLPEVSEYLPWLIEAFLSLRPGQRIHIAAPDRVVAALIWGLTRCLPGGLLRALTFSTYEGDITSPLTPLIAGTSPVMASGSVARDLSTFSGRDIVIDCSRQWVSQRAKDRDIAAFAAYATHQLLADDTTELDELLHRAQDLKVEDVHALLLVYGFYTERPSRIEQQEPRALESLLRVLTSPRRTATAIEQPHVQEMLLAYIRRDQGAWQTVIQPSLRGLAAAGHSGTSRIALRQLAVAAIHQAYDSIKSNQPRAANRLIELATLADPNGDRRIWQILFDELSADLADRSPAAAYRWETRCWLFEQWHEMLGPNIKIEHWLQLPWSEMMPLLATNLPNQWKYQALAGVIADHPDVPSCAHICSIVGAYYHVVRETLVWMVAWPSARSTVVSFFKVLGRCDCDHQVDLIVELIPALGDDAATIDALMQLARFESNHVDHVLETYYTQLLEDLAQRPSSIQLVSIYLDGMTADALVRPAVVAVLRAIKDAAAPPSRHHNVTHAWLTAAEFIERPTLDSTTLDNLAGAINYLPPSGDAAIVELLLRACASAIRQQRDLICALLWFEKTFGQRDSYYQGLFEYGTISESGEIIPEALAIYVGYVLDLGTRRSVTDRRRTVEFIKSLDREMFDRLDSQSRFWSTEAQARWNHMAQNHRPPRVRQVSGLFNRMKKVFEKRSDS
jgi:hypothetical protein